jgi:fimbrial chaperone protein
MRQAFKAVFFLLSALASDQAPAATLSVSPVSFDIEAPRQNAKLTLQNRGNDAVATQIRVFRWEKKNGADSLVPTKDVVASPPVAKLKPGAKHTVRIVRVAKRPVEAEESYRLLVDQLPKPVKRKGSQVSLLIRQSIPVFFSTGESDRTPLTCRRTSRVESWCSPPATRARGAYGFPKYRFTVGRVRRTGWARA